MQHFNLIFSNNCTDENDATIQSRLSVKKNKFYYSIKMEFFTEETIYEMISVINYVQKKYNQKVPIIFDLGELKFIDKLAYIILESICYYMLKIMKHNITISFTAKHTIWSEGIAYSSLVDIDDKQLFMKRFEGDIGRHHFRRLIPKPSEQSKIYLSTMMQDINSFLGNNGIDETTSDQLAEVLIELVGNAGEHGESMCILDIDITKTAYEKKEVGDENTYYGMNAVVANYSPILFFEPLKNKIETNRGLADRYKYVLSAQKYHETKFDDNYREDDFYTISSFQHKISGSMNKSILGGRGLTSLLRSLEENADSHRCYLLSGNRALFFEKEYMSYDENELVGFNKANDYLTDIPENTILVDLKTFFPGVAYNLSYAIKKEW